MSDGFRIEKDSLGEMKVPEGALYGAQTQRAVENFPISGQRFGRRFIEALGLIKKAAAETNVELGNLDETLGNAIVAAAAEVAERGGGPLLLLDRLRERLARQVQVEAALVEPEGEVVASELLV